MNLLEFIKKHPIRIGVGIIILSYIYELVFAGSSFRNRMPEDDAAYDMHETIAGFIMAIGCIVLVGGIVTKIIRYRKNRPVKVVEEEQPPVD